MANLRVIKKDVIFLINEVISDCWLFMFLNNQKNNEKAQEIIADAIALGDNLFDQINHYPKDDARNHFKAVNKKMLEEIDSLFVRLSELTK